MIRIVLGWGILSRCEGGVVSDHNGYAAADARYMLRSVGHYVFVVVIEWCRFVVARQELEWECADGRVVYN